MTEVASGSVRLDVNDAEAIGGLRAIEAQFESTTRRIDRMRAEADFGANTAELDQKIENAKRKLREFKGLHAEGRLNLSTKAFNAAVKKANAEIRALDGRKAVMELELRGEDKILAAAARQQKLAEERARAEEKRLQDTARLEQKLLRSTHAAQMSNMRSSMKLRQQSIDMGQRELSEAELLKRQRERDNGLLDRLSGTYKRLRSQLDDIAEARRKGFASQKEQFEAEKRELELVSRIRRVQSELSAQRREQNQYERDLEMVPRLQQRYAELAQTLERLNSIRRKGDQRQRQVTQLRIGTTVAEMAALKKTLERVGSPVDIDVELNPGREFGTELRRALTIGALRGQIGGQAYEAGRFLSHRTAQGFRDNFTRENVKNAILAPFGAVGRGFDKLKGLADMSVRLGPFTTSIRGAIVALTVLGPMLVDVAGSAGALAGAAGSAAIGLGAIGAAVLGGAIPAFLGMGLVVKDVAQEFTEAKKATKAYNDAVSKHGAGSDQAKKKQEELRRVLSGVSAQTAKQISEAQGLGKAWDQATKPARAQVWTMIGQSLKTADALLPMFARNTNTAMATVQKSVTGMLASLRSKQGRGILDNLMGNFNLSIGPVLDGLGQLAGYLGKVGSAASNFLPGFASQFKAWATGVNSAANNTGLLNTKVEGWITSLKTVGRFLLATGRSMRTFFGAGVGEGNRFLDVMTDALNKWDELHQPGTRGGNNLATYFRNSVDGARALWSALTPIGATFVQWAVTISPFVAAALRATGAIGQLVHGILQVTALRSGLTAVVTTLGALWAVNKVGSFVTWIRNFTAALFGSGRAAATAAGAAQRNAAAITAEGAAASRTTVQLRGLAAARAGASVARPVVGAPMGGPMVGGLGRAAEKTAQSTSKLARAGGALRTTLTGLGAVLIGTGGTAGLIAGVGIAAVGAGYGVKKFADHMHAWKNADDEAFASVQRTTAAMRTAGAANLAAAGTTVELGGARRTLRDATDTAAAAEQRLNRLRAHGKGDTQAARDAEQDLRQATLERAAALQRTQELEKQVDANRKRGAADARKNVDSLKEAWNQQAEKTRRAGAEMFNANTSVAQAYDSVQKSARAAGMTIKDYMDRNPMMFDEKSKNNILEYSKALAGAEKYSKQYKDAQAALPLALTNVERAYRGLMPIADRYAASLASLKARAPGIAKAISGSLKFANGNDAGKAISAANSAIKKGVSGSVVMRIVANSRDAETAIQRLRRAAIQDKRFRVYANGNKEAYAELKKLEGTKLGNKVLRVLGSDADARTKVQRLEAMGLSPKTARLLANNSVAMQKIAAVQAKKLGQKVAQIVARDLASSVIAGLSGNRVIGKRFIDIVTRGGGLRGSGTASTKGGASGAVMQRAAGSDWGNETPGTRGMMERAAQRVDRGTITKMSSAEARTGAKVHAPRLIIGEEPQHPEYVISTNPAYRKSNMRYLRQAASTLGIEMAPDGKDPKKKPKKPTKRKAVSSKFKKGLKKFRSPLISRAMEQVSNAEKAEETYEWDLNRKIDQLDEPDTFIDETKDPKTGLVAYSVNMQKIRDWQAKLNDVANNYDQLKGLGDTTGAKLNEAEGVVKTVEENAKRNMAALKKAVDHENAVIRNHSKDKDKTTVNNAKQRLSYAETERNSEKANIADAGDARTSIADKREDLRRRQLEYGDKRDDYRGRGADTGDSSVLQQSSTSAASQNESATPTPSVDSNPALTAATANASAADANAASIAAGLGPLPGFNGSSTTDAIQAQITAQTALYNQGMAMLQDGDVSNDADAYSIIQSASSTIQGLKESLGSLADSSFSAAQSVAQLPSIAKQISSQFASNLSGGFVGAMAARPVITLGSSGNASVSAALQPAPIFQQGPAQTTGRSGPGAGQTIINIDQTFEKQPEDPSVWANQMVFELRAAI